MMQGRDAAAYARYAACRRRVTLLALTVLAVAALLGARLYQLHVEHGPRLRAAADSQRLRTIEVSSPRGSILDRHGRDLALSVATQALFAHPRKLQRPRLTADLLAGVLPVPHEVILERLRSGKSFVFLSRFLEPEQVQAVRALDLSIGPGEALGFLPSSRRYYPRDKLGVHIVGFANIDGIGVEGAEKQFDAELRGDPIKFVVLRDARREVLSRVVVAEARTPEDLVLSVDTVLQHVVERELERGVRESGAIAASAVLLDPTTGQILALANWPAADPNRYGQARPEERVNRAVIHQYEPGSTFKIVPMAAALELGRLRPDQLFDCENGSYALGRRTIGDVTQHGVLSAKEIVQKSSNIGMVKIARTMEPGRLREAIVRFGFGSDTGIELPGEIGGIVHPLASWNEHSVASMAFGQEIGVTVLQMASSFATVANDGVRVPPRIALGLRSRQGGIERFAPPAGQRVISPRTARELTSMLEGVIMLGTGKQARLPGYRLAGKSGTAQKAVDGRYSESQFVASFGGFGPLPAPRLACLVVLDSPSGSRHGGGDVAAPVFARIMADALRHLRVPTDGESLTLATASAPAVHPAGGAVLFGAREPLPPHASGRVPDLAGRSLREAVAGLAARGYRVEVEGDGVVVAQHPAPGERLQSGQTCRLRLDEAPAGVSGSQRAADHRRSPR